VIRAAVAVGETGILPTANSFIAETFSRAERPRAMSTYLLGGPLSSIVGFFLGGLLIQAVGWRWAFVAIGSPGPLLSIIVWVALREPRRIDSAHIPRIYARRAPPSAVTTHTQDAQPSPQDFLRVAWASRTFRQLVYSYTLFSFFSTGIMQWMAAFYERDFGVSPASLGVWLALVYGVCGAVGIY
jgi:MFS transporter, Spinster family, sphingosine-1-phosphate transporter